MTSPGHDLVDDVESLLDDRPELIYDLTFERGLQAVRQARHAIAELELRHARAVVALLERFGAPGSTLIAVREARESARIWAEAVSFGPPHPAVDRARTQITGEVA